MTGKNERPLSHRVALITGASRRSGIGRAMDVLVINHARSSKQDLAGLTAAELDLSWTVNARAALLLVQPFCWSRHTLPLTTMTVPMDGSCYSSVASTCN
jgi:hypothetical protein